MSDNISHSCPQKQINGMAAEVANALVKGGFFSRDISEHLIVTQIQGLPGELNQFYVQYLLSDQNLRISTNVAKFPTTACSSSY